jgi:hypothetical protein
MAKGSWLWKKGGYNDHEVRSSLGHHCHNCINATLEVTHTYWEAKTLMPWPDVNLPSGWHLNHARIPRCLQ